MVVLQHYVRCSMRHIEKLIDKALAESKKGLFHNINKRKKAGKSRSKKNSTIDPKIYDKMKDW